MRVETRIRSTEIFLEANIEGLAVRARGRSFIGSGDTVIRVTVPHPFLHRVRIVRQTARDLFGQKHTVGSASFDLKWDVYSSSGASVHSYLTEEVLPLLHAVPPAEFKAPSSREIGSSERRNYYGFSLQDSEVFAVTQDFESDANRLHKAMEAAIALAQIPARLLSNWRVLAAELDGKLHYQNHWNFDGSTFIEVLAQGCLIHIAPRQIKTSWRRKTLRTRISSMRARGSRDAVFSIFEPGALKKYNDHSELKNAWETSAVLRLVSRKKRIFAELDGQVVDAQRLSAAVRLVSLLATADSSATGPYR